MKVEQRHCITILDIHALRVHLKEPLFPDDFLN